MEQHIVEQYLARIGYASGPEQQLPEPEPNPNPRRNFRLAAIEEVQAQILDQLQEQYAAQQQAASTILSRPAIQNCSPDLREEASSPSIFPDMSSTASTPGTESDYQHWEPNLERESLLPTPPSAPPTKAEILVRLHSELERRQKTCLGIERQMKACQKKIRTHSSRQKKIEKEYDKRIAKFGKPVRGEKQETVDAEKQKDAKTADEAETEEMRDIYKQYDRDLSGVPTAESVDAFFAVIANTENHLKKAEEANTVAKKREARLEEKLSEARCAVFEMEDEIEIEEVENGATEKEVREPEVEKSRIEGHKEGKRKPKRGKGVKDRQQGEGEGGDKRVRIRRKRRWKISSKAGKMSSDIALDS